jgi:predicted small secreted protein
MKTIRNIAALALIAASLTACGGGSGNSSDSKTIGGSVDTMNSVEGSNAGNDSTGAPMNDGADNSKTKDSVNSTEGNASPNGRPQN